MFYKEILLLYNTQINATHLYNRFWDLFYYWLPNITI